MELRSELIRPSGVVVVVGLFSVSSSSSLVDSVVFSVDRDSEVRVSRVGLRTAGLTVGESESALAVGFLGLDEDFLAFGKRK